jgi:hypothetical protein
MINGPNVVLSLSLVFMFCLPAEANTYFVDQNGGNDNNSGSSISNPFKTIRKACSKLLPGDLCYIRNGIYNESIDATAFQAYTPGSPITITNFGTEKPILSSLKELPNAWTSIGNGLFKTQISTIVQQVFVDGKPIYEARTPDINTGYFDFGKNAVASVTVSQNPLIFTITDPFLKDINVAGKWTGAKIWYQPYSSGDGTAFTGTITNHTAGQLEITPEPEQAGYILNPGNKYFLWSSPNALDKAWEWVYDNGYLNVIFPSGDNPANHHIQIRTQDNVIDLTNLTNIHISGLKLIAQKIKFGASTSNCKIDRCESYYPVHWFGPRGPSTEQVYDQAGIFLNGTLNSVTNTIIAHSAGSAVNILGTQNSVIGCLLYDNNWTAANLGGILSNEGGAAGNTISKNTIFDCGGIGIHLQDTRAAVLNNEISSTCKLFPDCGPIYSWYSPNASGYSCEIAYNWISEAKPEIQGGIYIDHRSDFFNVHHNVITVVSNGIQIDCPIANSTFSNNTIYRFWGSQYSISINSSWYNNFPAGGGISKNLTISNNLSGDYGSASHDFPMDVLKASNDTGFSYSGNITTAKSSDFVYPIAGNHQLLNPAFDGKGAYPINQWWYSGSGLIPKESLVPYPSGIRLWLVPPLQQLMFNN